VAAAAAEKAPPAGGEVREGALPEGRRQGHRHRRGAWLRALAPSTRPAGMRACSHACMQTGHAQIRWLSDTAVPLGCCRRHC